MASWDNRAVTDEHLLPYVDSNTAPPPVKEALQTLPFERNVFKLLANAPTLFPPFMTLLSTLWSADRAIRSSDWQLAVLRTAALHDAPYEWDVNEPVARIFDFSNEQLSALRNKESPLPVALFTARQQKLGKFIDELGHGDRVSETTMAEVKAVWGERGTMELFYVSGIYEFLAKMMNSCKIDFDEPIEGLEDMLRKYNAGAIEKERSYTD